jgi:23S rRNA (cytidine1920-2'-O)/16S rRNA (cytidine1409-2'-O)-methyltransferase
MPAKVRADQLLADKGLAESREKAKRLIMAGQIFLLENGQKVPLDKPGKQLDPEAELVVAESSRYVSRGGEKLETLFEKFRFSVEGKVCLDVGASTGGFTDCLLQHGAARVYAADVGYGQLDQKLRSDSRVVVMERVNLRNAPPDLLPEPVDLIVADVSFISLTKVLPPCLPFLKPGGELAALVKPQFELGPGAGDKGVIRDEFEQKRAVVLTADFFRARQGLEFIGSVPARIKGPKGNQEYLIYMRKPGPPARQGSKGATP